jgi:hypothetical protein
LTRQAVMSLRGADVRPQTDGLFAGIIHPFAAFDLLNDNTAGGVIDILKYHKEGSEELMRGVQGYRVIDVAGARFIETTTASTFAAFPSGTKTGYGTYVVGQDAVFSVSLGATEIPEQRNYQLIVRNWEPSVADPARVVGASCAYQTFGSLSQKCDTENFAISVDTPSGQYRGNPSNRRVRRDYTRNFLREDDIVRSAWRHAEASRNDLPLANAKVTTSLLNSRTYRNFKYAAMRVPQSAALHPRFRLIKAEALNGAAPKKFGCDSCSKSVNISEMRQYRAKPEGEGVETGWAIPKTVKGQSEHPWRHGEPSGNILAA